MAAIFGFVAATAIAPRTLLLKVRPLSRPRYHQLEFYVQVNCNFTSRSVISSHPNPHFPVRINFDFMQVDLNFMSKSFFSGIIWESFRNRSWGRSRIFPGSLANAWESFADRLGIVQDCSEIVGKRSGIFWESFRGHLGFVQSLFRDRLGVVSFSFSFGFVSLNCFSTSSFRVRLLSPYESTKINH